MRSLSIARIALGIVLVVRTTALANLLPIPLAHVRGPLLGWPDDGAAFAWGGLLLPPSVRIAFAIVRTVAAVCFLAGIRARLAGLVAGALGFVALSQDPFGFVFTLHALLLGTIAIALGDGASSRALVPDREVDPVSSSKLLAAFVASVYAWSAIAKLDTEWLSGRTLLALAEDGLVTPFVRAVLLGTAWTRAPLARAVLLAEVGLAVAVALGKRPRAVLAVALSFHFVLEFATRPDVMSFVIGALLVGALGRRA
jgi:hypothetical protein